MRWLCLASDIGLNPDSTILLKGINKSIVNKLSRKVLQQQPELQFRCSLVRSTLQLDTIPTKETVRTFAEHLLAELEQLMHKVRQPATTTKPTASGNPQVKSIQQEEKKTDSPTKGVGRHFNTEAGCRRGQSGGGNREALLCLWFCKGVPEKTNKGKAIS